MQVGDLVQLKSGGPIMTVAWSNAEYGDTKCQWFDERNELKEAIFVSGQLKILDNEEV